MTRGIQRTASSTEMRGKKRGAASNSTAQLLSFVFRAVSGVGVVVLIARAGGPGSLGIVQFALTLTSLLPFFFGVPTLLAREVARQPEDGRRWVETGTLIALLFGVGFVILLPAAALPFGASSVTLLSLPLAAVGMLFDGVARVQFAAFWAWERMDLETLVTGVQEAAYLAGTWVVLELGGGPLAALAVFAASRALGAVWSWWLVGRRLGHLPLPRAPRGTLVPTVKRCTPFAIADTFTLTYVRFDAVMLGVFKGAVPVGLYQAATNLVLYFNIIARSVNRALFPRMGRAWPAHPATFCRLRDMSLRVIAMISMPVTVGSLLLAPRTIHFLYGPKFAPVVLTYELLILVIPVRMAGNTVSLSISATDRQKLRGMAVAGAAAANVLLNLYFIPRWSYLGAAMTTVICEVGVLITYLLILRRATGPSEVFRAHAWPSLACIPLAGAVLLTRHAPFLSSVAAGALAYVGAVAVLVLLRSRAEAWRRPVRALTALLEPSR